MPKRSSKRKDTNVLAARIVGEATKENDPLESLESKNPNAVALGRLGGKKGGKARADKLSPERRREIARNAAQTRWSVKAE